MTAKDVDSQVVLPLDRGYLRDGCGGIYTSEVEAIISGIFGGPVSMISMHNWKQGRLKGPSQAMVILVLHVDHCLLALYSRWEVDVATAP